MKFKYFIVIITIATFLFNLFLTAYSQEIKPTVINVDVQNLKIKEIPRDYNFIGANWYWDHETNRDIFTNPEHVDDFAKNLKYLGTNIIRYPGGLNVWRDFWNVSHSDVYQAMKVDRWWKPGYKLSLPDFLSFCRKAELYATIQVNTVSYFDKSTKKILQLQTTDLDKEGKQDWNTSKVNWSLVKKAAESAAEEVKWVKNNNYDDIVLYWELGNEEYLRAKDKTGYTGKEYARVVSIFVNEMKKANPDIKIIITNTHISENPKTVGEPAYYSPQYLYNWNVDLYSSPELSQVKDDIYAVSIHLYPYGNFSPLNDYKIFKKSIYNNSKLDTNFVLNSHREMIDKYGCKKWHIFMNEFNSTDDKDTPYSNTWLAALGTAKMIMSSAENPFCHHMDYWALLNFNHRIKNGDMYSNRGTALLYYIKNFSTPFVKYPVGNVTAFLNKYIKGNVLKTEFNKSSSFYLLSIQKDKYINVILLNLDRDNNINLKLSGFSRVNYLNNKSLGINIPENFTIMDTYDSVTEPAEVRQLNELTNAIKVKMLNGFYQVALPANTLTVLIFEKN